MRDNGKRGVLTGEMMRDTSFEKYLSSIKLLINKILSKR